MLYGSECWPTKRSEIHRLMVVEMRMIRWMYGYTRLDQIRNEIIKEKIEVTPIQDKMRKIRLRWLSHVTSSENAPVRKCKMINLLAV